MSDTHLPPRWAERLCAILGAPPNHEVLRFLHAWAEAEGGTAEYNPLNTTYPLPFGESWAYNGSMVQNYFKPTAGVAATALTLIQDNFAAILGELQGGRVSAEQMVESCQEQIHLWGTNPATILEVLKTTP